MIERLSSGSMGRKAVEAGYATEQDIQEAIAGIRQWIDARDGTLGMMQGEVIITKT